MELYYDVEAHGEMHHNPAKNVLRIARDAADIAKTNRSRRNQRPPDHRQVQRKNARGAPPASHSIHRQDDVRLLERYVRFGIS